MAAFQRKSPLQKERGDLDKRERRFLEKRMQKKGSFLTQTLDGKVPDKLQDVMNAAFAKAFQFIFERGTGVIEKTYDRERITEDTLIRQYASEVRQTGKDLKAFSKAANRSGTKNLLLSGGAGVGMGILGIGIPDIPVFTGLILKNIYEIALQYGYSYDSREEKYYILLLIQGAMSHGTEMKRIDEEINEYIRHQVLPENYRIERQIRGTADALSRELLYMKFLQGIPIVGAVGGVYDAVYMKQITEYVSLKYRRRRLEEKKTEK
ncbi:MAG: EcsC family protein [Muricomes sp.]